MQFSVNRVYSPTINLVPLQTGKQIRDWCCEHAWTFCEQCQVLQRDKMFPNYFRMKKTTNVQRPNAVGTNSFIIHR